MTYAIEDIIKNRHSIRAFTQEPVPKDVIHRILDCARFAPSGTNIQPWQVYVVSGQKKQEIIEKVSKAFDDMVSGAVDKDTYQEQYRYYPQKWVSPFIERRRENGWGLYGLLDIKKGERDKINAQQRRNFCFFDAPIGLFFTVDPILGDGSKMDVAMFMQNMMLLAKNYGLDTCPQAAWNHFHRIVLPLIGAKEGDILLGAMALGYANQDALVNTFTTPREDVDTFTHWLDVNG